MSDDTYTEQEIADLIQMYINKINRLNWDIAARDIEISRLRKVIADANADKSM